MNDLTNRSKLQTLSVFEQFSLYSHVSLTMVSWKVLSLAYPLLLNRAPHARPMISYELKHYSLKPRPTVMKGYINTIDSSIPRYVSLYPAHMRTR